MHDETVPQPDEVDYRDYLVAVFDAATYQPPGEFGPPPPPAQRRAQTLATLRARFKQAFDNADETIDGDRQYLDALIARTLKTADSLAVTYRIDLSRREYETTTRICESIRTLQRHLRDGHFHLGNPFFLYRDEWRRRFRSPFFPENGYALKRGLFVAATDRDARAGGAGEDAQGLRGSLDGRRRRCAHGGPSGSRRAPDGGPRPRGRRGVRPGE